MFILLGVVLFEVLRAPLSVDPLLGREEVKLGQWTIQWKRKWLLRNIVDVRIADEIKPTSLKNYGDTNEKCLADYCVESVDATNTGHTTHIGAPEVVSGVDLAMLMIPFWTREQISCIESWHPTVTR
ncbi:hypothetical protein QVD17_35652 [Tagetes erecta]|uniref:Uncharacterized protein n=1 Tax=Tagetes erecta TaxID=13708 RepID=A0AAD8NHE3_TARER|nr:hypothetical protein QVD17_35652 [Tagetes erecta]